jgi:hypothetical protein
MAYKSEELCILMGFGYGKQRQVWAGNNGSESDSVFVNVQYLAYHYFIAYNQTMAHVHDLCHV